MRIALISDIHGNLTAFNTVLADIKNQEVDEIICLGDVSTMGPHPHEVLAVLRDLKCDCVMGNHDAFLIAPGLVREVYPDFPTVIEQVEQCAELISEDELDYLRTFQPRIEVQLGDDVNLLCFHGTPHSKTGIILATTPAEEIEALLAGYTATVMAGGHTHVQMMRRHKETMIVNTGSIGAPFAEFSFPPRILPWAEYAIVNWIDGVLSVELRRVTIPL